MTEVQIKRMEELNPYRNTANAFERNVFNRGYRAGLDDNESEVALLQAQLRYVRTVLKGVLITTMWNDFLKRFNKVKV